MIPALALTAGLGTRVRPLSYVRAKGALPVAGEPLVRRILRWLGANGVTDAVLNLHHLPHTLTSAVGDGHDLGIQVRYSWEDPVLGSAGGPKRALGILGAPRFLIVNGDTLTDLPLEPVVHAHAQSGALVTMAVVPNREPQKYSGLAVDRDGHVTGVVPRGGTQPSFHFFGVQVVEAMAFDDVPQGVPYETVSALYPRLIAARPGAVRAFHAEAESLDIGTPSDYLDTSLLIAGRENRTGLARSADRERRADLDAPDHDRRGDVGAPERDRRAGFYGPPGLIGQRTRLEDGARVERSILWDDVVVGAGAMLKECVVTDGVQVPADTSWHGVSLRVAGGELAPGERRIGGLAIASL